MEFALGGDLNKILEDGKRKGMVPEEEIWNILVQMTMGIKTLHDLGILHRDLKLANVFI
jgi:NIMA (never in mitosis gene a)-related kinase